MASPTLRVLATAIALSGASAAQAYDLSANISIANNYLWRGLTQSQDKPAVSGGIDLGLESGFYVGTWVSNVEYAATDAFSYEHDMYAGYAGEFADWSYDIGYLYYNYNEQAGFDFGEIYASLGYHGFSVTGYIFTHTEYGEDNGVGEDGGNYDFGFGSAYYISGDYGFEVHNGIEVGLHVGYHDGDFVDAFNFANGTYDYVDWNVSIAKGGFGFMVSGTDLDEGEGQLAPFFNNNEDVKFVVSYSLDFEL